MKPSVKSVCFSAFAFIGLAVSVAAAGEISSSAKSYREESPVFSSRYSPIAKGPSDDWFVDWDEAQSEAKRTKRRLLVWCECRTCCRDAKLSRLLAEPIFLAYARENLVLMYFCRPFGDGRLYEPEQMVQYEALSSAFGNLAFDLFLPDGRILADSGDLLPHTSNPRKFVRGLQTIDAAKAKTFSRSHRILFDEGYSNLVASLSIQCATNDESWAVSPAGVRRLESRKFADRYRSGMPDQTWSPTWEQAVANARKSH